jgi:N4-(beta-N-acetylglucosaminyl)-L-asparaginase
MTSPLRRRDFLATAAAGLTASWTTPRAGHAGQPAPAAPAVQRARAARPVVVASDNGNRYRNGGAVTCVEKAFTLMTSGSDVLDALIAGVNIVELDPEDDSVGYGGKPNADGVVQLDASVMHGPTKRAGAVACLEGVRTPSLVARAVMLNTDHHLLVGRDAQTFARQMGFTIEADLNTERSRRLWLEWKRRIDPARFLDPATRAAAAFDAGLQLVAAGLVDPEHMYGTINCNGVGPGGEVCGVTTTSGLAWKIPGRVEANLYGLCSFAIVEGLRRGQSPKDAGLDACRSIQRNTVEKRLLNPRGLPNFNVNFYVVNARGEHAGVSLYPSRYAVCTDRGPESLATEALFEGSPTA